MNDTLMILSQAQDYFFPMVIIIWGRLWRFPFINSLTFALNITEW